VLVESGDFEKQTYLPPSSTPPVTAFDSRFNKPQPNILGRYLNPQRKVECSVIPWSWDKEIETHRSEVEDYLDDVFNMASLLPSHPRWTSVYPSPLPSRYDNMGKIIPPRTLRRGPTLPQRVFVATHAKLQVYVQPINGLGRKARNLTEPRAIRCRIRAVEFCGTFRQPIVKSRVLVPDDEKICSEDSHEQKRGKKGRLRRWCRSGTRDEDRISAVESLSRGGTFHTRK
jgi:hypothetical protein